MVVQRAAIRPVFARRRCRTEPTFSHSERRSSAAKQVFFVTRHWQLHRFFHGT